MTYNHLTIDELIWVEKYYEKNEKVSNIAKKLNRSRQTIYNVINYLKQGKTVQEYFNNYKKNKQKCGARKKHLNEKQMEYVKSKLIQKWSPDVIVGRKEIDIGMSARTLYRRFKDDSRYNIKLLPMQGKRKENGYKEKRGKQQFRRSLKDRAEEFPNYENEFGHLEGDTIIGKDHQSTVITLVERISKAIIVLKPKGRTAKFVEERTNEWLANIPLNLFKSITTDCGKEFSNWKEVCNKSDISIFFADSGCPSQRGLNENSNGLLRRDGLPKQTDFNELTEEDIIAVAQIRNNIPRKSLDYKTPIEVFKEYVCHLIK